MGRSTASTPGTSRRVEDLDGLPTYTVDDLRRSVEEHPPYGDYQGVSVDDALREPLRIHMSGGTTGEPRPTLYTQWDRGVSGVLNARGMYLQGLRPGDVVVNSWAYGLHNGAFSFDEIVAAMAQLPGHHRGHGHVDQHPQAGRAGPASSRPPPS